MKVVFSIDHLYLHGGAEKVLVERANYFSDILNYEVFIVTTEQKNKPSCYRLSDKITMIDLAVNYERAKSYLSFQNLKKIPFHFIAQIKLFYRIKPDVVLVFNYAFDFYWIPFIHKSSKKIKEYHSSQFGRNTRVNSLKNKFGNWLRDFTERNYDAIVVLNPDEKKYFKVGSVFVIPNPVQPTKNKAELVSNKVIAAGRIAPVKGFDRLIEAWSLIANKYPEWSLDIYGEDYLNTKEQLQNQIDSLGLSNTVKFKGTVNNITRKMCDYSIYAMTSHTECFPMVLLESLSVGLPIIAFDVPSGPRNIVTKDVDGFLVENNNITEFANAIEVLIKNKSIRTRMGEQAKGSSASFYVANVMLKWERLFSVLNKN